MDEGGAAIPPHAVLFYTGSPSEQQSVTTLQNDGTGPRLGAGCWGRPPDYLPPRSPAGWRRFCRSSATGGGAIFTPPVYFIRDFHAEANRGGHDNDCTARHARPQELLAAGPGAS